MLQGRVQGGPGGMGGTDGPRAWRHGWYRRDEEEGVERIVAHPGVRRWVDGMW